MISEERVTFGVTSRTRILKSTRFVFVFRYKSLIYCIEWNFGLYVFRVKILLGIYTNTYEFTQAM